MIWGEAAYKVSKKAEPWQAALLGHNQHPDPPHLLLAYRAFKHNGTVDSSPGM